MDPGHVLYLSRKDVETIDLPMREIIDALEQMFKEKGAGKTEMPPKPGIHTRPDAFIHAMPAYIPSLESAGLKWVSGYPDNPKKGLPYITGLLILNDPDTGVPLSVMDCTWITAKRTGAATAIPFVPPFAGGSTAGDVTAGPGADLWFNGFTLLPGSVSTWVARMTLDGRLTQFPAPVASRITTGPDGNVWFTTGDGVCQIVMATVPGAGRAEVFTLSPVSLTFFLTLLGLAGWTLLRRPLA